MNSTAKLIGGKESIYKLKSAQCAIGEPKECDVCVQSEC